MTHTVHELVEEARLRLGTGALAEAVRLVRRALLQDPSHAPARLILGRALIDLERYEEARAELLAVLKRRPDDALVHRLLGEAYLRTGHRDRAREHVDRALHLEPTEPSARELADELERTKGEVRVSETIERWFEADPTDHGDPGFLAGEPTATSAATPAAVRAGSSPAVEAEHTPSSGAKTPVWEERETRGRARPAAARAEADLEAVETRVRAPRATEELDLEDLAPAVTESISLAVDADASVIRTVTGLLVPEDDAAVSSAETDAATLHRPAAGTPPRSRTAELESAPTRIRPQGGAPVGAGRPAHAAFASSSGPPASVPGPTAPATPALPGAPPQRTVELDYPFDRDDASASAADETPSPASTAAAARPRVRGPRWRTWVLAAVGGAVVSVVAAAAWRAEQADAAVRAAVRVAENDGLRVGVERALSAAVQHGGDDGPSIALRARLLATLVFEHGLPRRDEAEALLRDLGRDVALADARVARAFLFLAAGNAAAARAALARPEADEDLEPEEALARALAAMAHGDLERAVAEAATAAAARPGAPRYAALLALLTGLHGDAGHARALLDRIQGGDRSPYVRVARARVLWESGSDPARALEEAAAVVERLVAVATPAHKAWAHLLRAEHALERGTMAAAAAELSAAEATGHTSDGLFILGLAEALVRAGRAEAARARLSGLGTPPGQEQRRARLEIEIALRLGHVEEAVRVLDRLGAGEESKLYRARVLVEQGQLDEASRLFEEASRQPRLFVRARTRLGALALSRGDVRRATEVLAEAVERAPADPETVPLFVQALLAAGRIDRAEEATRVALALRGQSTALRRAALEVRLARGETEGVLEAARALSVECELEPGAWVLLAEAARRTGHAEEARSAIAHALELAPRDPAALVGQAALALDAGDLEGATSALERATQAGARGSEVDRARVRLGALRGQGEGTLDLARRVAEASHRPDDRAMWGRLLLLAERDDEAERVFEAILRDDREHPEALLGLVAVATRAGSLPRASANLGTAERVGRRRGLGEAFEARVLTARGRLRFELGDLDAADGMAAEALRRAPRLSEAHLLRANVASERREDPTGHLEAAVAGEYPVPEALAALALRRGSSTDGCRLARQYLEAAPRGYDADELHALVRRCP